MYWVSYVKHSDSIACLGVLGINCNQKALKCTVLVTDLVLPRGMAHSCGGAVFTDDPPNREKIPASEDPGYN